tara:strand:+ start:715 stop:918 length:204 start_codon:yes stop_codon:yes gene_type:complete
VKQDKNHTKSLTMRNLVNALVLSQTARNRESKIKAINLIKSLSKDLKKYQVKKCRYDAVQVLQSMGI